MSDLTALEKAFCEAYVATNNAGDAVTQAGYKNKNPEQTGSRLLKKRKVQDYCNQLREKIFAELNGEHKDLVKFLLAVLNVDYTDFVDVSQKKVKIGRRVVVQNEIRLKKNLADFPPIIRKTIKKISVDRAGNLVIDFESKIQAFEALAKHLKFYGDDGSDEGDKILKQALEELRKESNGE